MVRTPSARYFLPLFSISTHPFNLTQNTVNISQSNPQHVPRYSGRSLPFPPLLLTGKGPEVLGRLRHLAQEGTHVLTVSLNRAGGTGGGGDIVYSDQDKS